MLNLNKKIDLKYIDFLYKKQRRKLAMFKHYGCLGRPYKYLWKEEKWKAKEKRKDINIWMQSSKE